MASVTGYFKTQSDSLLAAKAPLASPALTGTPSAPTASAGTSTTQLATTAFVAAAAALKGPAVGSTAWLQAWGALPGVLVIGAITRNGDGAATAATVAWPDNSTGAYVGTPSSVTPGAIDSYAITYAPSGGTTKTVTQPLMTRDPGTGLVTSRPAITVA